MSDTIHHLKLRATVLGKIAETPELDGKPLYATKIGIFASKDRVTYAMIEMPVEVDFEGGAEIALVQPQPATEDSES